MFNAKTPSREDAKERAPTKILAPWRLCDFALRTLLRWTERLVNENDMPKMLDKAIRGNMEALGYGK